MRIVFLRSSDEDVRWFSRYYRAVFHAGSKRATTQMRKTLDLLRSNPLLGRPGSVAGERRLVILSTPFVLEYRVAEDRIEILRVLDGRARSSSPDLPDEGQIK